MRCPRCGNPDAEPKVPPVPAWAVMLSGLWFLVGAAITAWCIFKGNEMGRFLAQYAGTAARYADIAARYVAASSEMAGFYLYACAAFVLALVPAASIALRANRAHRYAGVYRCGVCGNEWEPSAQPPEPLTPAD